MMVLNIAMFGVCLDGVLLVQLLASVLVRTCTSPSMLYSVGSTALYDFHVQLECVSLVLKMRCDFLANTLCLYILVFTI